VWAKALAEGAAVRVAIDQSVALPATLLHEGAEVAFFPPVTGG
jgi:molybdopterin synthase sulfur carrier subunit